MKSAKKPSMSWLPKLLVCVASLGVLMFIATGIWIGKDVSARCRVAEVLYEEPCVEALILFVDDGANSYADRNSAIWALGQLGDDTALPMLEKYYTGDIPKREPLDKAMSQYELKKAINLLRSDINITALIWRR